MDAPVFDWLEAERQFAGFDPLELLREISEPMPELGPGWRTDPAGKLWYSAAWLGEEV